MKKILNLTLFLAIILICNFSYGERMYEGDHINLKDSVTGSTKEYKTSTFVLGGKEISTEIPGIIYVDDNGESTGFIPVEALSNYLEGKIESEADVNSSIFTYKGNRIEFTIGSNYIYINGEKINFPNNLVVKKFSFNDSSVMMVPARFISEQLGLEVFWDGETNTTYINKPLQYLKGLSYDENSKFQEIRLKTTGDVDASSYFVEGSKVGGRDKAVFELQNVIFDMENEILNDEGKYKNFVGGFEISNIEAYQSSEKPYKVRVDIDLNLKKSYDVWFDYSTNEIVIQFINSVWGVTTEDIYNAKTVVIETGEDPAYNVTTLNNKVIVDVINANLKMNNGRTGIIRPEGEEISSINYMQFNPEYEYEEDDRVSRIVVNLGKGISTDNVYVDNEGENIYVYVSGKPLNGFDYAKNDIDYGNLNINFDEKSTYSTDYNKSKNELTLKIPKKSISLESFDINIDDNIVDYIKIDDESDTKDYIISIKLSKGTSYALGTKETSVNSLEFTFLNSAISNSKYRGILVVIDPGHGGSDPGAHGDYLRESDVNLKTAKYLRKKLEGLGFNVYMTRTTDKYVGLYDRPNIANDLRADLFVSIHANAATSRKARGIETFYCPQEFSTKKYELAKNILDSLIAKTGAVNRGAISKAAFVVTRETKMPSTLVELGFLTNPEEEQLLMKDSYLELEAEAIKDGILKFMK